MASQIRLRRQLCALALAVLWGGCIAGHVQSAAEVAQAFAKALDEGRAEEAYQLLSTSQKQALTRDKFLNLVNKNRAEVKALSKQLRQPVQTRVEATVLLADGRSLRLVEEHGGLRFDEPVVDVYGHPTPAAARDAFVRAIEARRWDALLTLMPSADARGLDAATLERHLSPQLEELSRLAALLQSQREAPIEIVGDRATMPYGEGSTMRFVRESDGWKVEEPE